MIEGDFAWALRDKKTKKIEKLFLFDTRKEAREWAKDRNNYHKFTPVQIHMLVVSD